MDYREHNRGGQVSQNDGGAGPRIDSEAVFKAPDQWNQGEYHHNAGQFPDEGFPRRKLRSVRVQTNGLVEAFVYAK
jgi:hypothetical protein